MTVHLDWPAEVVQRLTEEARRKGLSLDDYLLQTVLKTANGATPTDESERHQRRQAAAARILEIQKRVKPDPEGWTSRDYINYGRH